MTTTCFLIDLTDRGQRWLRRFTYSASATCPLQAGGHDASVRIDDAPLERSEDGFYLAVDWPHDDPRWPATCACGYAFQEDDHWQGNQEPIYSAADGTLYTLRDAPPGAMWDAPWMADFAEQGTPDGRYLMLRLPDRHDWAIDGPSISGGGWTRIGVPPRITALPSILSPGYHGWLQEGVLSDDIDKRTDA